MKRALLAGLLTACRELPEVTSEGKHVRLAADPEFELCGGTMVHIDEFVARLSAEFGIDPPTGEDRPLGYWLRTDDFQDRSGCAEGTACQSRGTFYAWWMPANHEIVHAVLEPFGSTLPLLSEGLAVAYQGLDTAYDPGTTSLNLDIAPLVAIRRSIDLLHTKNGYRRAGNYVALLIERHGPAAVLRLVSLVDWNASEDEIDRAFRDALGVSLDDTLKDYERSVRYCSQQEYDKKLIECAAPELTWRDGRISEYRVIACEQDDAVGPYTGDTVVVFRTLKIAESGFYAIESFGDGSANRIVLHQCGGCETDEGFAVLAGEPARTEWLNAGTYSVRLLGSAHVPTSIGLRIAPQSGAPGLP